RILSSRVSKPLRNTQALNGLMLGPAVRKNPKISLPTRSASPSTAPPTQRPCPSRNFVAEWITKSAPSSSGLCNAGVQKQLSTASELERPLQRRRTEAVVDCEEDIVLVRELRQRANVADGGQWIGRGLQVEEPRVRLDSEPPRIRIIERHVRHRDAEFDQVTIDECDRRAEHAL